MNHKYDAIILALFIKNMAFLQQSLKRTIAALIVGFPRNAACFSSTTSNTIAFQQHVVTGGGAKNNNHGDIHLFPSSQSMTNRRTKLSQQRLFSTVSSSSFSAPEPPQSKGYNVFEDIDFEVANGPNSQSTIRNSDPNAVFVVTGANRGIGLQFTKKLLQDTKGTVVGCCRSPENAASLHELSQQYPGRLDITPLDLESQHSIEQTAAQIKSKYDRVDILLNVAGILGDAKTVPGPERSVSKIERDWLEKTFAVNVFGPVMLSKELAPLMAQKRRPARKNKNDDDEDIRATAVIANLSARVGSISDNGLGGWYSYRMSKSALNQATRTLANELKRQSIWCIALHPGTTDTDLSKPFQKNVQEGRLFPVDFTVDSLMKVIDSMDDTKSGGLYDWAGKAIPF